MIDVAYSPVDHAINMLTLAYKSRGRHAYSLYESRDQHAYSRTSSRGGHACSPHIPLNPPSSCFRALDTLLFGHTVFLLSVTRVFFVLTDCRDERNLGHGYEAFDLLRFRL